MKLEAMSARCRGDARRRGSKAYCARIEAWRAGAACERDRTTDSKATGVVRRGRVTLAAFTAAAAPSERQDQSPYDHQRVTSPSLAHDRLLATWWNFADATASL
jgi:hypothetical protein